jgi:hypothetical protein
LHDGDVVAGEVPDGPVRFTEAGLQFDADVRAGQKTGHFLDQRANRIRVGEMSAGRDVLDVFASTGGFSVHAAAGGATSVHASICPPPHSLPPSTTWTSTGTSSRSQRALSPPRWATRSR